MPFIKHIYIFNPLSYLQNPLSPLCHLGCIFQRIASILARPRSGNNNVISVPAEDKEITFFRMVTTFFSVRKRLLPEYKYLNRAP